MFYNRPVGGAHFTQIIRAGPEKHFSGFKKNLQIYIISFRPSELVKVFQCKVAIFMGQNCVHHNNRGESSN